jgi:carbonic anhydrase
MRFQTALSFLVVSASSLAEAFTVTNGDSKAKMDKDIDNIFKQNQKWKQSKLDEDPEFFSTVGSNHKPNYMWIGCSDARVPANEVMGEATGSVFVVRNVANMVVNTDFNLMGALQYAVDYLKIPHIIVCGHYDCGGIRASMEAKDHVPPLENWLRNVRDVHRLHRDELDAIEDPEQRHRRLVELNVVEQCINLFKTGAVQRRRVATYKEGQPYTTPRIHACVFDPQTGGLKRLDFDFYQCIDELHDIYDLYTIDDKERRLMKAKRTQHSFSFVANDLTNNVNLGKVIGQ